MADMADGNGEKGGASGAGGTGIVVDVPAACSLGDTSADGDRSHVDPSPVLGVVDLGAAIADSAGDGVTEAGLSVVATGHTHDAVAEASTGGEFVVDSGSAQVVEGDILSTRTVGPTVDDKNMAAGLIESSVSVASGRETGVKISAMQGEIPRKTGKDGKKKGKKKKQEMSTTEAEISPNDECRGLLDTILTLNEGGYGAVEGESQSKREKREKRMKKTMQDVLKIDMASERTFFKWFRTGMQIGAIGTFVFIALDKGEESPWRFAVVAFAWLLGLLLVLYGLFSYYQRRAVIRGEGEMDTFSVFLRDHSPVLVVAALVLVVGAGLAYAVLTGQEPSKKRGNAPYVPAPPGPPSYPAGRTRTRRTQRGSNAAAAALGALL